MLASHYMDSGASLKLLSHLAKARKEVERNNLSDDTLILEALERELNNISNADPKSTGCIQKIGVLVSRITNTDICLNNDDMTILRDVIASLEAFGSSLAEVPNVDMLVDTLNSQKLLYEKIVRLLESDKSSSSYSDIIKVMEIMLNKDRELKRTIEALLGTYEERLGSASTRILDLTMELRTIKDQNDLLKQENNRISGRISNMSEDVQLAKEELQIARNKANDAEQENIRLKRELETYSGALQQSNKRSDDYGSSDLMDRLEKELHNSELRNSDLQKTIRKAEAQIRDLQREVETLDAKYKEQCEEYINLKVKTKEFKGLESIVDDKTAKLRKLESEYQDKEREYNELFQNYCKILKENERLYVDNVQATKGIRHLRSLNVKLKTKIQEPQQQSEVLLSENNRLKEELAQLNVRINGATSQSKDIDSMRRTISELEGLLKRSEAARKAVQNDYQNQLSELQDLKRIADELNKSPLTTNYTPFRPHRNRSPVFAESSDEEYAFSPTNDQLAVENRILHDIVTKVKEDLRLAAAEESSIVIE